MKDHGENVTFHDIWCATGEFIYDEIYNNRDYEEPNYFGGQTFLDPEEYVEECNTEYLKSANDF